MIGAVACRGVFLALTELQEAALVATRDDEDVRAFVQEIEEMWDDDWLCEVDKAWDAMHRCLADGTLALGRHGGGPLQPDARSSSPSTNERRSRRSACPNAVPPGDRPVRM